MPKVIKMLQHEVGCNWVVEPTDMAVVARGPALAASTMAMQNPGEPWHSCMYAMVHWCTRVAEPGTVPRLTTPTDDPQPVDRTGAAHHTPATRICIHAVCRGTLVHEGHQAWHSITRRTQQYAIVQATWGHNPILCLSFTSITQDLKKPCTEHGAMTHHPH